MKTIVLLLLFALFSVSAMAQENLIVDKITFSGNKKFPNSKLQEEITIESTSWIKKKIFKKEPVYFTYNLYNDDIHRLKILYQKEGFLNIAFDEPIVRVNKKNKVEITVFVREGEPVLISEITFLVDSTESLHGVLGQREEKILKLT